MSASEIAATLTAKLDEAAKAEAQGAVLASLSLEALLDEPIAHLKARLQRKTRTLIFTEVEAYSANGPLVARASAIHRITEQT